MIGPPFGKFSTGASKALSQAEVGVSWEEIARLREIGAIG